MKRREQNARQMVDRFLVELGAPVSDELSERATEDALERLRTDDVQFFTMPAVPVSRFALPRAWAAIAAAVIVLLAGGLLQMTLLRPSGVDPVAKSVRGELRSTGVASLLNSSARIEAGRVVRAGAGGGALTLLDGSQIDMSPNAELSIIREADGLRVQLSSGTVLVTAAKQHDGGICTWRRRIVWSRSWGQYSRLARRKAVRACLSSKERFTYSAGIFRRHWSQASKRQRVQSWGPFLIIRETGGLIRSGWLSSNSQSHRRNRLRRRISVLSSMES